MARILDMHEKWMEEPAYRAEYEALEEEFALAAAAIAARMRSPLVEISEICRRYGVKELSVFGSAVRGELRPGSDIDLLVDFLPDARPGLLGLSAMARELSDVVGRRVDLAVKPALKPLIRPEVLAEAQPLYAA